MQYKQQVQAMIQNGVKQSTILEVQRSNNVAELLGKLKQIEAIEAEQAQAGAENEHERAVALEKVKEDFAKLQSLLRIDEINAEWDRKDENTMLKGEYDIYSAANLKGDGDADNNGIPDAVEISKRVIAQQKILSEERKTQAEISHRDRIHKDNMKLAEKEMALEKEKLASKERTEKLKARAKTKK
jgi:hypothetical protein